MHDYRARYVGGCGTGDDHDGGRSPVPEHSATAVDESLAGDLDQDLGLAQTAAFTRGQQDSGDRRQHEVKAIDDWGKPR